jgi:hypothetical protein
MENLSGWGGKLGLDTSEEWSNGLDPLYVTSLQFA